MGAVPYEGLFYLAAGFSTFLVLTLGLRILGDRMSLLSVVDHNESEQTWHGKERLEIVRMIEETHDIKTFYLRRANGMLFPNFHAGQFLSFQIGDDATLSRSYSLSSCDTNRHILQVSIKKLADGVGSSWFHERKVGDEVLAYSPTGQFIDEGPGEHPRVYVAGGIGITPILSMISSHLEKAITYPMTLFYGIRTEADLAFDDVLQRYARRYPNFTYVPVMSEPSDSWAGERGFVNKALMEKHVSATADTHFYVCGPTPMTESLLGELSSAGVSEDRLHHEAFVSPKSFDRENLPDRDVCVTVQGQQLRYQGHQTLLEFLESKGISHPFACRVGVCGSCKCPVKGDVVQITDAGLTDQEKRLGYVLACVAFPTTDIVIDPKA